MKKIPDDEAWGDYWRLGEDSVRAHKLFYGQSQTDMLPFFENSPLSASEYLRHMPPQPFQYYVFGFVNTMTDKRTAEHIKLDMCFPYLYLVSYMILNKHLDTLPVKADLLLVIDYTEKNLIKLLQRQEDKAEAQKVIAEIRKHC